MRGFLLALMLVVIVSIICNASVVILDDGH